MEIIPFSTDGTTDREPLFGNTLLWKECQKLYTWLGEVSAVTLPGVFGKSCTVKSLHNSLLLLATFPLPARERGTSLLSAHATMLGSSMAGALCNWAPASWGRWQRATVPPHEPGGRSVGHGRTADLSPPRRCPPHRCSQALAGMLIAFELPTSYEEFRWTAEALCLGRLPGLGQECRWLLLLAATASLR